MVLPTIENGIYSNNVPLCYFNPVWGVYSLDMMAWRRGAGGRGWARVGCVWTFPLPGPSIPVPDSSLGFPHFLLLLKHLSHVLLHLRHFSHATNVWFPVLSFFLPSFQSTPLSFPLHIPAAHATVPQILFFDKVTFNFKKICGILSYITRGLICASS